MLREGFDELEASMNIIKYFFIAMIAAPALAQAICVQSDFSTSVKAADFVAVVTITSSNLTDIDSLKHGKYYSIRHTFRLERVIKGSSQLNHLISFARFVDPSKRAFHHPERIRIQPGDSVLIVVKGSQPAELSPCSASQLIGAKSNTVRLALEALGQDWSDP